MHFRAAQQHLRYLQTKSIQAPIITAKSISPHKIPSTPSSCLDAQKNISNGRSNSTTSFSSHCPTAHPQALSTTTLSKPRVMEFQTKRTLHVTERSLSSRAIMMLFSILVTATCRSPSHTYEWTTLVFFSSAVASVPNSRVQHGPASDVGTSVLYLRPENGAVLDSMTEVHLPSIHLFFLSTPHPWHQQRALIALLTWFCSKFPRLLMLLELRKGGRPPTVTV